MMQVFICSMSAKALLLLKFGDTLIGQKKIEVHRADLPEGKVVGIFVQHHHTRVQPVREAETHGQEA
jgi:hypothetical protein